MATTSIRDDGDDRLVSTIIVGHRLMITLNLMQMLCKGFQCVVVVIVVVVFTIILGFCIVIVIIVIVIVAIRFVCKFRLKKK